MNTNGLEKVVMVMKRIALGTSDFKEYNKACVSV